METEIPPLVAETIALTEKKVAMALDDIIKMSKRNTKVNKGKRQRRKKNNNKSFNGAAGNNTSKVRHFVNSLSAVRQGAVAKRWSNFKGNQFPVTANIPRKAFNAGRMTSANQSRLIASQVQDRSVHAKFITKRHEVDERAENGGRKRKTLDARFAVLKEQRKSNNNNYYGVGVQLPRLPPWARAIRFPY